LHTSLKKLENHPDYKKAKAGDVESAIRVVQDLIKPAKIEALYKQFPDAIVVAPHAEEMAGNNAIPHQLAMAYGDAGFAVDEEIVQKNKVGRTVQSGALRLAVRPSFDGKVEKGRQYIVLDDALGQGGTSSELRHYIENNGGEVVYISALTAGIFGAKVSIKRGTITNLINAFGRKKLEDFLHEFNTAGTIEALTEKEGRKILGFRVQGLNALRNQIFKEAKEANVSPRAWQVQTPVQEGLIP